MSSDDAALLAGITVAQHEAAHDIVTVLDAHPAMQVVRADDRLRIAVAVARAVTR